MKESRVTALPRWSVSEKAGAAAPWRSGAASPVGVGATPEAEISPVASSVAPSARKSAGVVKARPRPARERRKARRSSV